MTYKRISVIGAGAWGTTLAHVLASNVEAVDLWCYEKTVVETITKQGVNSLYLGHTQLNHNIYPTNDIQIATAQSDIIFWVTPFTAMAPLAKCIQTLSQKTVIIATKGIDVEHGYLSHEIMQQFVPLQHIALCSGASFAKDVASHKPALLTIASTQKELYDNISTLFCGTHLSIEYTHDMIGVALGGALKNALSIACGFVHGLDLGESARAAVLIKGIAEMQQYLTLRGVKSSTLFTSAILGDLLMTATSMQSRNTQLGFHLAKGHTLEEVLARNNTVTEGVNVVLFLAKAAQENSLSMPIFQSLASICEGSLPFDDALHGFIKATQLHVGDIAKVRL